MSNRLPDRRTALLAVTALILLAQSGLGPASADQAGEGGGHWFDSGCTLIPVTHQAPFGAAGCAGIRPGAFVQTSSGSCTINFAFRDGDGATYMGTAAHCVPGFYSNGQGVPGDRTWAPGAGPHAYDRDEQLFGQFVYAFLGTSGDDRHDFALIRLNSYGETNAERRLCYFNDTPTGTRTSNSSAPVLLHHYGNGLVLGQAVPARTAAALDGTPDPSELWAYGAAVPGDSGSPVVDDDGRAVGVMVAIGAKVTGATSGDVLTLRIEPQRVRAAQRLGVTLTLLTV